MRTIRKRVEPRELAEWRARNQADPGGSGINHGYDALRQNTTVCEKLEASLISEQGGLCAYTGRRISKQSAHIEHLKPQTHCERGEDVEYTNLVACWPQPNCGFQASHGAHPKGDWPEPSQAHLFISPLGDNCESRFKFDRQGNIVARNQDDVAATTTIRRLNLDDQALVELRKEAINAVLNNLDLRSARIRQQDLLARDQQLNDGSTLQLAPFCFAIRQALEQYIEKLERIRVHANRQT